MEVVRSIIERHLNPRYNYIYGFADLNGLLEDSLKQLPYGIAIGKRLDDGILDAIVGGPTMEYYQHYHETNRQLTQLSEKIARDLNREGIESLCMEPTIPTDKLDTEYYRTLRAKLSHKMVATRAGLGWIGKTDLFVSRILGTRLRLVSILTSTPLEAENSHVDKSRCGTCRICVDACPAKAANGLLWDITIEREQFFDAHKCREMCRRFGEERLGKDARVCGICVSVCPLGAIRKQEKSKLNSDLN
jgi:epoxyqueuosine reductase QueG